MSAPDAILLITHSADHFTIDRVTLALHRRGVRTFRLDTDLFPLSVSVSRSLGSSTDLVFRDDRRAAGSTVDLQIVRAAEVRSVWMRKIWAPRLSPDLATRYRALCASESRAAITTALDGLGHARWLDPLPACLAAQDKLRQLRLAIEAGLRVPDTLLSNDPAHVRSFVASLDGAAVTKLLLPISASMEGNTPAVLTNNLNTEDLLSLDSLRHCPMLVQRRIEKAKELRVIAVDGDFYAGAIQAPMKGPGAVDWRGGDPATMRWEPAEVPSTLASRLRMLMRSLDLRFGAIDVIETPGGEHVFLEVNPTGEWGMLERDLGLPISNAIAEALLQEGTL